MGQLPSQRIQPARPFLITGVDFCGSIYLRPLNRRSAPIKAYIALFVCFTTKAIHIELVIDLTTQAFIGALRRFFSQRGESTDIFCDNATNFVGTKNELAELHKLFNSQQHQQQLTSECTANQIQLHFIPPGSPHFGGLWEAAVKSAKYHLKRIVGNVLLSPEEMYTTLAQIEACLNLRPLTPLSDDPSDLQVLTPGHFFIGSPLNSIAEPDLTELAINRLSRWQRVQQLYQHFWNRWSIEYLTQLQQRAKWHQQPPNIEIGSLVLLKDKNQPPFKWSLRRVVEIHQGIDGKTRVVSIRTAQGTFKRSITKICPLPLEEVN